VKQKLGLDLDGVLYPFVKAVETFCRVNKSFSGTTDDFHRNLSEYWEKFNLDWLVENAQLYQAFIPSQELMGILSRLADKYEIYYISSRPESVFRVTQKYLREYGFPNQENLYFSTDKETLARFFGLSYFVDDNVVYAESLDRVCMSLLMSTPYNEKYHGNYHRINTMKDLEIMLL